MIPLSKTTGALVLALCLVAMPAFADRTFSSRNETAVPSNPDFAAAVREIDKKNYQAAIPLLQKVVASDPKDADAYNYLGYTHRQLGKMNEAVGFYQQALSIDPDHLSANEYLGELYLQVGDLGKAQKRLEVLDDACFFGCDQYYKLRDAIDAYRKKTGSG